MARNTIPDYHFLLIADNLGAEYLFDSARDYWNRFRPTVISDLSFVALLPREATVAVTALTRRDRAGQFGVELARLRPEALYDPVVHDFFEETRITLNERARLNQPFGVPLAVTLEPTVPANLTPVQLTPGSILAPPATPTRPPAAAQTPPPEGTPRGPLYPTPGPITGGTS